MSTPLKLLIQAGNPLISIQTSDEPRVLDMIRELARSLARPLMEWSLTDGLTPIDGQGIRQSAIAETTLPAKALEHLRQCIGTHLFVLKDLGPHGKDPRIQRLMRDLVHTFSDNRSTIILVDAAGLPDDINRLAVRHEVPWPTPEELEAVLRDTFKRIRKESIYEVSSNINKREMEQLVHTLRGLTCAEAERVVAAAIYDDYCLDAADLPRIIEAKRTLLGSAGCLESIAVDFSVDDVGGLDNLKAWLKQRRGGFTAEAHQFGLEPPRGVLMLGIPGCGKSLCAKAVAADWNMPLLRLDPGVLYQKFVGESESQLRQALAQAEAMAPVILWVDEIEKAFASASASSADGGLSQRMFGTLLSWMQDHRHPIFIIATANDVSALPPELMRKGRFDEVFFIDLPTQAARERILSIHIERRRRDPAAFNLPRLAETAADFSGSEIEQAVVSALFAAFRDRSELTDDHIVAELNKTQPLAILMQERIAELRQWAENRCVPAD